MDYSTLIGIVGLVATLVFGALSIILVLRRRYPGELTFVRERTISLFHEIVKNLPEISILYGDSPVAENVVMLRGALLNTGAKDLTPEMVADPLRAVLPAGYRWLAAKVISMSPGVSGSIAVDGTELQLHLGLFRKDEFVRLEALVEVPPREDKSVAPSQRLVKDLSFLHRIADTGRVRHAVAPATMTVQRKMRLAASAIYLVLVAGMLTYSHFISRDADLVWLFNDETGLEQEVRAIPRADDVIRLKATDGGFERDVPVHQFTSMSLKPVVKARNRWLPEGLLVTTLLSLILVDYLPAFRDWRRARNLRRIMGEDPTDPSERLPPNPSLQRAPP